MRDLAAVVIVASLTCPAWAQEPARNAHENTREGPEILLYSQLIELSRTKLRNLGIDFENKSGGPAAKSNRQYMVVDSDGAFLRDVKKWKRKQSVKVLAEPTVLVRSGQRGGFRDGGEAIISRKNVTPLSEPFGTTVDLHAMLNDNGAIRMDLRFQYAVADYGRAVKIDRDSVPVIRRRTFACDCELKPGQTLVLWGATHDRVERDGRTGRRVVADEGAETETILLVRPELGDDPGGRRESKAGGAQ